MLSAARSRACEGEFHRLLTSAISTVKAPYSKIGRLLLPLLFG
jgi:hypothetical protein